MQGFFIVLPVWGIIIPGCERDFSELLIPLEQRLRAISISVEEFPEVVMELRFAPSETESHCGVRENKVCMLVFT